MTVAFSCGQETGNTLSTQIRPSTELIYLLLHLDVTIESSYISSSWDPDLLPDSNGTRILANINHANSFPPDTPRPIPSASKSDAPYASAKGQTFNSYTFGDRADSRDDLFTLLWDERQSSWIAIYRLTVRIGKFLPGLESARLMALRLFFCSALGPATLFDCFHHTKRP